MRWRCVSLVSVVLLAACTRPATQLVGVVASDLPAEAISCSSARVSRFDGATVELGDRRMFVPSVQPTFSFGVTPPGGDPRARVEITVEAWASCGEPAEGERPRASRTLRTGFLPDQAVRVDFFLSRLCLDVVCPEGSTCDPGTGACVPVPELASSELVPVRPGEELLDASRLDASGLDAGATTRPDAGPVDAGPAGPSTEMLRAAWILEPYETTEVDPLTRISAIVPTRAGIVVAGIATGAADFGDTMASALPISSGGRSVWLALVAPDGTLVWVRRFAGSGFVYALDLVDDRVVATGTFVGTLDFAPGTITAVDAQDAFAFAFDPADGASVWATSFGNGAGNDAAEGAADTAAGVLVASNAAMAGTLHVDGGAPPALEGPPSAQALALVLDPATGAARRSIGLGATDLDRVVVRSDAASGAILGLAGTGRVSGLHPIVSGGGAHQLAIVRLDDSLAWRWTTHLEGCTGAGSIRVARAAGSVWAAFTATGCPTLSSTLADAGGVRAGPSVPTQSAPEQLVALALDEADGAPRLASVRAVTLYATGGYVGTLAVDGADDVYVGGWMGLPSAGAMLDFGAGATLFNRNTSGTVQSNGAAFVWSVGPDGSYRGVDTWSFGGAGAVSDLSDCITGLALDGASLYVGGWLHNQGFLSGERVGGGFGFDIAVLFRAM